MIRSRCAPIVMLLTVTAFPVRAQGKANAAHDAVVAADKALSDAVVSTGLLAAIPQVMDSATILLWPGADPVRGARGAERYFRVQASLASARVSWQPLHVEISPDKTLALLWGVAVLDRPQGRRIGRYLAAWRAEGATWRLSAISFSGVVAPGETIWGDSLITGTFKALASSGPAGKMVAADFSFSELAGRTNAANAFATWAAPDATTFGGTGELTRGPAAIGGSLADNHDKWRWWPVAAGASADGALGWTIGEAVITSTGADGKPEEFKSKYLTQWRRQPDGSIKFIADGGSGRP